MSPSPELLGFSSAPILGKLHPFQRDAVEHAFNRLFIAPDSTRRFLVADEVGLGKTLIAKGVIAKAIEHMRHSVSRIDIVYICSNQSIARQNINRLNPLPDREMANAERITLLPLHLKQVHAWDINLIAFTPGTSLDVRGSLGTSRERRLLYLLLEQLWSLKGVGALNVLQGNVESPERFREGARELRRDFQESLNASTALIASFSKELVKAVGLKERFLDLCERFSRSRKYLPDEDREARNAVIGELRVILARTCIAALEPDLIILDEFQRFRELLGPVDGEGTLSEAAELARQLFGWSDGNARAHVLLLSATPYKPYTLQHEEAEENHYADFLRTVEFLQDGNEGIQSLKGLIDAYRTELLHLETGNLERLATIKSGMERALCKIMSRTERLAVAGEHNGMLRSVVAKELGVEADDIRSYLALRAMGDLVEAEEPMEYWKSAAYPLDFMAGYQLKEKLRAKVELVRAGAADPELQAAIREAGPRASPLSAIQARQPLNIPNAKMRHLIGDLETMGAFDILWVPPCLPSYVLEGAFAKAKLAGMTKRLIFSAWNVAPRSIAVMVSYEAERRAQAADQADKEQIDSRREQGALLRLARDEGRPSGMPVVALMYPSTSLAELCDPHRYGMNGGAGPVTWDAMFTWAKERIRSRLPADVRWVQPGEQADEVWYWATPLLLDQSIDGPAANDWWQQEQLAASWSGADPEEAEDAPTGDGGVDGQAAGSAWASHVQLARQTVQQRQWPQGPAPVDLVDVLALLGLAGPANCALRSLSALLPTAESSLACRNSAAQVGWLFRRLFNRPQSISIVRSQSMDQPYWRQTLDYGAKGGLDDVLREYVHVLQDAMGVAAKAPEKALDAVVEGMEEALGVRAAVISGDQIVLDEASGQPRQNEYSMTSLFAMRFGSDKSEDAKQAVRDSAVRAAFNSPFWPFVLASTSVGQEGLDFHWYCHAVVHWNLPSNPVDMEQREGRVHRYKGHAVRKNVAGRWVADGAAAAVPDRWKAIFALAERDAKPGDKGLVPYWLYPVKDGAWIERHVPLYPLSRDELRYEALKKALGAYRIVFGQPRQDELLAYLLERVDVKTLQTMDKVLRIDLSPPPYAVAKVESTDNGKS